MSPFESSSCCCCHVFSPSYVHWHVLFRKYSNLNFRVSTVRDTKIRILSRWKKSFPLIQQYNHFKYLKICLCARMLVLEWKERAFIEKVNSRCFFCWFPAAILVHQNGTPIWCRHTKLYKGAWNVSANNSELLWATKTWDLNNCLKYILVFYNISFFWFLPLDGCQFSFLLLESENDL